MADNAEYPEKKAPTEQGFYAQRGQFAVQKISKLKAVLEPQEQSPLEMRQEADNMHRPAEANDVFFRFYDYNFCLAA